jgi:hypothetical protein
MVYGRVEIELYALLLIKEEREREAAPMAIEVESHPILLN